MDKPREVACPSEGLGLNGSTCGLSAPPPVCCPSTLGFVAKPYEARGRLFFLVGRDPKGKLAVVDPLVLLLCSLLRGEKAGAAELRAGEVVGEAKEGNSGRASFS